MYFLTRSPNINTDPVFYLKAGENVTSISDELVSGIFSNYHHFVRPRCSSNSTVYVVMDLALRQIIELNEPKQILHTNCWLRNTWSDCRLKWNKSEYHDIDHIVVPSSKIWYPDLTLYDSSAEISNDAVKDYRIRVDSDGSVSQLLPMVLASLCNIDVSVFPFDEQVCNLTFGMWIYNGLDVDLAPLRDADLSKYVQHVEWFVKSMEAERIVGVFNNIPYPTVVYRLVLKRKSLFYMINLIFPCMLISTVALMGFILPSDSGEKVNLEVTVLLSLAVFQLIVLDMIPPSSETLPLIGLYFASTMVMVAMSCLMTVLVLNVHFRGVHGMKPPRILKKVIIGGLGKVFCLQTKIQQETIESSYLNEEGIKYNCHHNDIFQIDCPTRKPKETRNNNDELNLNTNGGMRHHLSGVMSDLLHIHQKVLSVLDSITNNVVDSDESKRDTKDWHLMAIILDRFFLLIFLLISLSLVFGFVVRYLF
ncbi:hypothetical protein SNE40_004494 [Patella caerulea]|uniref:Uncharacterized protein n=1 Tax=Patella caerulea TaxID=87958 RepID=A0AAN8K8X1_PATCE